MVCYILKRILSFFIHTHMFCTVYHYEFMAKNSACYTKICLIRVKQSTETKLCGRSINKAFYFPSFLENINHLQFQYLINLKLSLLFIFFVYISIYIYILCLSVCFFVCPFVSNKRQTGRID